MLLLMDPELDARLHSHQPRRNFPPDPMRLRESTAVGRRILVIRVVAIASNKEIPSALRGSGAVVLYGEGVYR